MNVRVLAATNRKLREAVLSGECRNDLYFRLNVITLEIPPLREKEVVLQRAPTSLPEIGRRAAEQAEKSVAWAMLERTGWNRKESARRLQISYKAIRNRLQKWQLYRES